MITGYSHGWSIIFENRWIYQDNGVPISHDKDRPCKKCNKAPTKEGYDACLGYVFNMKSVCCGHGVTKPIRIKNETL